MYDDPVVLNDWHPVAHGESIGADNLTPARVMGVDLVVWRSDDGVHVWHDRCAHRGVKLSLGTRCENRLVCAYHGWEYEPDGVCVRYPAHERQKPSPRARAKTFPCQERYGLVWVCLGEPANDIPSFPEIDQGTHLQRQQLGTMGDLDDIAAAPAHLGGAPLRRGSARAPGSTALRDQESLQDVSLDFSNCSVGSECAGGFSLV